VAKDFTADIDLGEENDYSDELSSEDTIFSLEDDGEYESTAETNGEPIVDSNDDISSIADTEDSATDDARYSYLWDSEDDENRQVADSGSASVPNDDFLEPVQLNEVSLNAFEQDATSGPSLADMVDAMFADNFLPMSEHDSAQDGGMAPDDDVWDSSDRSLF
jgi:flagellar capping protein FliD